MGSGAARSLVVLLVAGCTGTATTTTIVDFSIGADGAVVSVVEGGVLDSSGNRDVGGGDGGGDGGGLAGGAFPVLYTDDRTLSPATEALAAHWRSIAGRKARTEDVFAKIGASNTVNTNFLHCFAGSNVDLDGRTA